MRHIHYTVPVVRHHKFSFVQVIKLISNQISLRSRTILLIVEWSTPPLRRSGPRKRTRELGELSGEGAEPGENFSVVVLTLTLIAEELTPCSVKALAQAFNKKARVRNP